MQTQTCTLKNIKMFIHLGDRGLLKRVKLYDRYLISVYNVNRKQDYIKENDAVFSVSVLTVLGP